MSENRWREIFLSELNMIRIVCQHKNGAEMCGAVIQVPLSKLNQVRDCPLCTNPLQPGATDPAYNPFRTLPAAIKEFEAISGCKISFIVPFDEPSNGINS
jgi:hypothetical protein